MLGESLARIIFQLMTAVILIVFGVLLYNFTLAHGFVTFLDMMLLCLMGVLVFMGFGYTISGLAKSQHVIPVYANLFMFPQFFLSGTFFPKTLLPAFLQPVLEYLPPYSYERCHEKDIVSKAPISGKWEESWPSCWDGL